MNVCVLLTNANFFIGEARKTTQEGKEVVGLDRLISIL